MPIERCASVNPLSRFFQLPLQLPTPAELFVHPDQPIHLDIGCARGRCILGLAELNPAWNHLGVEIRRPLVTSADRNAVASGNGNVRVLFCNANISLESWLAALPEDRLQRFRCNFPTRGSNAAIASGVFCNPLCCWPSRPPFSPDESCFCRAMCWR